jgi:hypothetical protein
MPSAFASAICSVWKHPAPIIPAVASTAPKLVAPAFEIPQVKGEPPFFSLKGLIDRFLFKWDDNIERVIPVRFGGPRTRGCFHPSEICKEGVCPRALAYELVSAPKAARQIESRFQRIFQNGHFVHARLQYVITKAVQALGGRAKSEAKWTLSSDMVSGSSDMVIVLPVEGALWPYVVEIKSMKLSHFQNLGAAPWPEHRMQINTYMHKLGVPAGFVLVECKDNQELREYFVRRDNKLFESQLVTTGTVMEACARKELPDPVTKEEGCKGEECPFWNICKGPEKGWSML